MDLGLSLLRVQRNFTWPNPCKAPQPYSPNLIAFLDGIPDDSPGVSVAEHDANRACVLFFAKVIDMFLDKVSGRMPFRFPDIFIHSYLQF
jgi:hypothetical protein